MKKIALGLAMTVALVGCDMEQEAGEANIGEEAAAETEQAMEETGAAMERAGDEIAMALQDLDADADGYVNQQDFDRWWQENDPFADWDADANGVITENEISGEFDIDFDTLDADGSGDLTEEELRQGLFEEWDENDDGRIGQDEFPRTTGGM